MATATLPPMGKLFMIGIWIESVLYGVNCALYGLCMFILLRGQKIATLRWVLVVTSTILFLLCTVHVGVSLQQLLDAFIHAPTDGSDYYWLDSYTTLRAVKYYLFNTTAFFQDFILIWRLYVVFMCDWRVILLPAILEAIAIGFAYSTSAISVSPSNESRLPLVYSFLITGLTFSLVIDIFVMVAIVARLWWMGRKAASLTTTTNRFTSSIYIVVESGTFSVVCATTLLVLFLKDIFVALPAIDVASQLAVFTPLLIVVQAGLSSRSYIPNDGSSRIRLVARDKIAYRHVPRGQGSLPPRPSRTPSSSFDV